ncbi:MAG: hypothetical protein KBS41_04835, partial [Oscillospiraceae bacterium]|nr:hypothetical protein [Candidatus Equicaccousia limihippi]
MQIIKMSDMTLCYIPTLSFKEKIEVARLLVKLGVNSLELPNISDNKVDSLFVKTVAPFLKDTALCVSAFDISGVDTAVSALKDVKNPEIKIELPLSTVGMEYQLHIKPAKMAEYIEKTVSYAKTSVKTVEFSVTDATRADKEFLVNCIKTAKSAGADRVTLSDNAADILPDDFALFAAEIKELCDIPVYVCCQNK